MLARHRRHRMIQGHWRHRHPRNVRGSLVHRQHSRKVRGHRRHRHASSVRWSLVHRRHNRKIWWQDRSKGRLPAWGNNESMRRLSTVHCLDELLLRITIISLRMSFRTWRTLWTLSRKWRIRHVVAFSSGGNQRCAKMGKGARRSE
jgi:hypothetical protein